MKKAHRLQVLLQQLMDDYADMPWYLLGPERSVFASKLFLFCEEQDTRLETG
jgi:hypothetical protein